MKNLKLYHQLKKLIKKYLILLKLTDWSIDIVINDKPLLRTKNKNVRRIKDIDYYAEVFYNFLVKGATIVLINPDIKKPEFLEDTILHEMLHIKFSHLLYLSESVINILRLPEEKRKALYCELANQEHIIIENLTKLLLKRGKNGQ